MNGILTGWVVSQLVQGMIDEQIIGSCGPCGTSAITSKTTSLDAPLLPTALTINVRQVFDANVGQLSWDLGDLGASCWDPSWMVHDGPSMRLDSILKSTPMELLVEIILVTWVQGISRAAIH